MTQLEIQFFWPLTQQIPLELDYSDCAKQQLWWPTTGSNGSLIASGDIGTTTWAQPQTIQFRPSPTSVGYWQIGDTDGIQMHSKIRPNWLNRKMTKLVFGWEWKDEGRLQ